MINQNYKELETEERSRKRVLGFKMSPNSILPEGERGVGLISPERSGGEPDNVRSQFLGLDMSE